MISIGPYLLDLHFTPTRLTTEIILHKQEGCHGNRDSQSMKVGQPTLGMMLALL